MERSNSDSEEYASSTVMDALQRPIAELEKKLGIRFDDSSDEEKEEDDEDSFDVRHDSEEDEIIEDDRAKLLQRAKRLLELSSFDTDSDDDLEAGQSMENATAEAPPPSTPTLRKTSSLPAYDLALRREDDAGSSSDTNRNPASAPSGSTPLDAATSPSSTTSSVLAAGVPTERQGDASPKQDNDTLAQLPKVARSAPTLERSHTSGELIGLRTKERQAAESTYSSPSSGSAPSFEIESVTLPNDGVKEADIDKTTHTVFSIEVKLQGGLQWLIRKRYSDFRELHERLKRTNAAVKQLYFPKRHVFRNRHQSVVEQRRSELEKYINEVLDIRPLIRVPLFNFLEVYAHMESYERKLQRHKKELESERMKNMLPPELLDDFSTAFKRLCSSKYLYHGNTSIGHKTEAESSRTIAGEPSKGSTTDESGNRHSVIMHTAGSQICISRASFRRDILGVFPDMPSSFAMRFMKAVSDRQGSDINMDEFLRAVAILRCGTMDDQLQFIFNMCDLDHAGKVQSTGLSNFLVSLHGRNVLDRAEYRRLLSEGFDQGRVRMSCNEFVKIVPELKAYHTLVDWMAPFADILCETADPQLLESQEEFNPAVQQKILANETHFNAKEVSVLQDAFNNYRASAGGDAVDLDALTSDFPLEMSEERFSRVFSSFGSRANGTDIDVFSFVSALSISCRGTTKEKSEFAFKLFASVGGGSYMTREDVYGMLRLDITQNPDLESQITALIEKKHPSLNATKSSSSSSLIESMGPRTPSVSGSELGIFVDGIMKGFGHRRSVWDASSSKKQTEALTLTLEEFTAWTIKQKYEMATLRIMREVAFIDLGLVPATKEEELLIATGCYTPYEPTTLVEDDRWYLIERKWYIHWCRYIKIHVKESLLLTPPVTVTPTTATSTPSTSKVQVNGGSTANKDNYMKNLKGEIVRPKCINNYPLLTSDRRDRILKTSEDIKLGRHYVIICTVTRTQAQHSDSAADARKRSYSNEGVTTIFDLKHELMKMCHEEFDMPGVSESDIKLCEFSGSMILSFKADNRRVGQIRSIDRLIAFQLEPLDSDTIQATRHRRPSYVQAVGVGGLRSEEADHSSFYEKLSKGVLVDVRMRTQSHEYIPAVVMEPPSAHADYEDQPVVLVRLRRTEDEIKVPLNRLRPRQARLLYIPLLSRKLSYSAVYFKNPFRPVPFGSPNLVRLCPELTSGLHLYQLVWERVKQYVGPNAIPPTEWVEEDVQNGDRLVANHIDGVFAGLNDASADFSSKCGFLLRRVETKGLTDSRSSWLTRSFGFTIPCTSEPLDILEEEAITVDWDLSVFQDREMMDKMKHVENHDSVARNEAIDKGPVPLSHCLDAFTSEEKISEGYCSSCRHHQEMTKKLEIWRLPPVMVVHLKRFQYTQTYRRKLASLVEFPIHDLDLSSCVAPHIEIPDKYPMKKPKGASSVSVPARRLIKLRSRGESNGSIATAPASQVSATGSVADEGAAELAKQADGDSEEDAQGEKPEDSELATGTAEDSQRAAAAQAAAVRNRVRRGYTNSNLDQSRCLETKYNLYGVVNHQGALGGGHYTAYAKNFVDDQWYYYDDERVRVVEEQQVVSPSAYLLFYIRSDMDSVLVKDLFPKNMKPGKITDEDIERFVEEGDERRCSIM
uniref:ubiquitinyl hydrolase 1 n=1 Tax=Phytophthora ramorum TaxID=164328 RepID=H3HDU5_PHYRM